MCSMPQLGRDTPISHLLRRSNMMFNTCFHVLVLLALLGFTPASADQSETTLDEMLDEEMYLRGLCQWQLPEVFASYRELYPAEDPFTHARYGITERRMLLYNPTASVREQLIAIDDILNLRQTQLIDAHPDDYRRALWLMEQAADLYFEKLAINDAELTVLFGLADADEITRVRETAQEIKRIMHQAERAISDTIHRYETDVNAGQDLERAELLRSYERVEQQRRVPFFHGIAVFLEAHLQENDSYKQAEDFELAVTLLEPLGERLSGWPAAHAQLYAGLAHAHLGRFDEAEALFRTIATNEDSRVEDVFAARMGGVLNRRLNHGVHAGLTGLNSVMDRYPPPDHALFRLLMTDQHAILLLARAEEHNIPSGEIVAEACSIYEHLLRGETTIDRLSWHEIVYEHVYRFTQLLEKLSDPPPLINLARASQLRKQPMSRAQALELYETVLRQPGRTRAHESAALFGMGQALFADESPIEALHYFLEVAKHYSVNAEAEAAVEHAVTIAAELHRINPQHKPTRRWLDESLHLILTQYPNLPSLNRWRFYAGKFAISDGRYEEALDHYLQITPDNNNWLDAQFMTVFCLHSLMQSAESEEEQTIRSTQLLQRINKVRQYLEYNKTDTLHTERSAILTNYLTHLQIFEAQGMLVQQQFEDALQLLHLLEEKVAQHSKAQAAVQRALVEAYLHEGQTEAAYGALDHWITLEPSQAYSVVISLLTQTHIEIETLLDRDLVSEAQMLSEEELYPLAARCETWLADRSKTDDDTHFRYLQALAEAHRVCKQYGRALQHYEQLLEMKSNDLTLLLGQAECLYHLGSSHYAKAMPEYQRIALAGAGDSIVQHRAYWTSQLRMLQILDAMQRNTHQVIPRIQQLRYRDLSLGGERFQRHFLVLEQKYLD